MNGKTILVIDDDIMFTDMLAEVLRAEGATVEVVHTGAAGITRAGVLRPDLILCDVMMPSIRGTEVLKLVRASEWGDGMPFILLSNMSQPEIEEAGTGYTECLLKTDHTLNEIAEKIKTVLAKQAG